MKLLENTNGGLLKVPKSSELDEEIDPFLGNKLFKESSSPFDTVEQDKADSDIKRDNLEKLNFKFPIPFPWYDEKILDHIIYCLDLVTAPNAAYDSNLVKEKWGVVGRITDEENAFISKLGELFKQSEATNNNSILKRLSQIVVGILELNNESILNILMSKDHYNSIFGNLEYDEVLKNIIKIDDSILLENIDVANRLAYLKDSVINTHFKEPTVAFIAQQTFVRTMEVLKTLITTEKYYRQLVIIDKNGDSLNNEINEKRVKFMNEILHTLKQLKINNIKEEIIALINQENSMLVFIKRYLTLIMKGKYSEKYNYLNNPNSRIGENQGLNGLNLGKNHFPKDFLGFFDDPECNNYSPEHLFKVLYCSEIGNLSESENSICRCLVELLINFTHSNPSLIQEFFINDLEHEEADSLYTILAFIFLNTRWEGLQLTIWYLFKDLIHPPQYVSTSNVFSRHLFEKWIAWAFINYISYIGGWDPSSVQDLKVFQ